MFWGLGICRSLQVGEFSKIVGGRGGGVRLLGFRGSWGELCI